MNNRSVFLGAVALAAFCVYQAAFASDQTIRIASVAASVVLGTLIGMSISEWNVSTYVWRLERANRLLVREYTSVADERLAAIQREAAQSQEHKRRASYSDSA